MTRVDRSEIPTRPGQSDKLSSTAWRDPGDFPLQSLQATSLSFRSLDREGDAEREREPAAFSHFHRIAGEGVPSNGSQWPYH